MHIFNSPQRKERRGIITIVVIPNSGSLTNVGIVIALLSRNSPCPILCCGILLLFGYDVILAERVLRSDVRQRVLGTIITIVIGVDGNGFAANRNEPKLSSSASSVASGNSISGSIIVKASRSSLLLALGVVCGIASDDNTTAAGGLEHLRSNAAKARDIINNRLAGEHKHVAQHDGRRDVHNRSAR